MTRSEREAGGVLHAVDVMPLLLEATPSFVPIWQEIEAEYADDPSDERRLHFLDAAAFAQHLLALHRERRSKAIRSAFDVIERMEVEGDAGVRNLATMGFLEGVQNLVLRDDEVPDDEFAGYLDPASLVAWVELHGDWGTTNR